MAELLVSLSSISVFILWKLEKRGHLVRVERGEKNMQLFQVCTDPLDPRLLCTAVEGHWACGEGEVEVLGQGEVSN